MPNKISKEKNLKDLIKTLLAAPILTPGELMSAKRRTAKISGWPVFTNSEILKAARTPEKAQLKNLLKKRAIRTLSGIAPVAVLTKPYPCPAACAYCPTEKNVPKSYLSNEPAVMRAIRNDYDPYRQVEMRLRALEANGHVPEKIELIVIGGTWSVLPEKYKFWYIWQCFKAANEFKSQKPIKLKRPKIFKVDELKRLLTAEQKKNEKARYKIVGLTLETRPDHIDEAELREMRTLGCTRVELGVQAVDDKILEKNKRGHGIAAIIAATALLKNFGFKTTYHVMPGLPGSTPAKDLQMFKRLFTDERFQPDQIKFYPTVVTKGSLLYRWWRAGKYKPYADKQLQKLIVDCKRAVPEYARIIRLVRDIPEESIEAGNRITNLRQVMQQKGAECRCIRCREAREKSIKNYGLKITNYPASGGEEYFIQAQSKGGETLYGFCRLRLNDPDQKLHKPVRRQADWQTLQTFSSLALIRELHVYGELVPVGGRKKVQHAGLGRQLMAEAEKIAARKGFKKIAVISGIGARGYYRKLGYRLKDTYMTKKIDEQGALQ